MLKAKKTFIAAGRRHRRPYQPGSLLPDISARRIRLPRYSSSALPIKWSEARSPGGLSDKMIDISGFPPRPEPGGYRSQHKDGFKMFKRHSQAKKIIEDFKPELLAIGFGGYVSGPVIRWRRSSAACRPLFTSRTPIPALTNKTLAKQVDAVMLHEHGGGKISSSRRIRAC